MDTMQPVLKNGRNTWDLVNMPEAEFTTRLRNLRKAMKTKGLDILLLYGNGFNEYGNYCYVTNFIIRLPQGALVAIPFRGEVVLFFEGAARGIPSVRKTTWVKEIRACGNVAKEIVKYIDEKKLTHSVIGFAGLKQFMAYDQLEFLYDSLAACSFVDETDLLKEIRMVKSEREADQMRRASRILIHTISLIPQTFLADPNEKVLEAILYREARLEGAEDFRVMIGRPKEKEKWAFRPAEEKKIGPGETTVIYLAVMRERYWAEALRTFLNKEGFFEEVQSERLNIVYERMIKGLRPGKRASQFYEESMAAMEKEGREFISDYSLGQGIGLSPKEFPVFCHDDKTVLTEGMSFSFRLLVKDREFGAIGKGHTIHLTRRGPEVLT